ncbi:MAG: rhomboid family intramembrane serine protease [Deltaproteobacteria bacterium]|nr:rhomboid family intramembrane serine protease [Deltaproteobacteria bacterium]
MISVRAEEGEETLSLDEFEGRVRRGQITPSTPVRFPVLTGDRWVDARDLELFRRLYEPARVHFSRAFSTRGIPVVTLILVVIDLILFFGLAGTERSIPVDPLINAGAKVSANVFELGETWRLLTANLLHRDLVHLAFNLFFLFNVGGTIENAYRTQDYLLIVVVSGLATMLVSAWMSPLPSVGASGIVLGLFGAASVFGAKYADILPQRYRRYFGGAVLPYALFVLYVGLVSPSTDNWGHLGGLLGGAVAAIPLAPRLLHLGRVDRSRLSRSWPLALVLLLIVGTLAAGPIVKSLPPSFSELTDRESGLEVVYPKRWSFGENHLGYVALGNTLGASLGLRARRDPQRPVPILELKRRFLEQEIGEQERDGHITSVEVVSEHPLVIAGARGLELVVTLESRAGRLRTRNVLVERGYYSYAIVLSAPEAFADAYEPIFDHMIQGIRLVEPPWLAKARGLAVAFPGMSSAHLELGQQLASLGEAQAAAQAYQEALRAMPDDPEALTGLARLAVDYGGDLEAARAIAERLYQRKPEDPEVARVFADLLHRLGRTDAARTVLQEAIDHTPDAKDLREHLLRLR